MYPTSLHLSCPKWVPTAKSQSSPVLDHGCNHQVIGPDHWARDPVRSECFQRLTELPVKYSSSTACIPPDLGTNTVYALDPSASHLVMDDVLDVGFRKKRVYRHGLKSGLSSRMTRSLKKNPHTSEKRCFMCGNVGHIETNPVCPKFSEPTPAFRFRATRVYESYIADDKELEEEPTHLLDDWTGSQYEGKDRDNTDLADLVNLLDDKEETDARVGVMRFHYYSLHVEPKDSEDMDEMDLVTQIIWEMQEIPPLMGQACIAGSNPPLFSLSAHMDLIHIMAYCESLELPELSKDEQGGCLRALKLAHLYPPRHKVVFEDLAHTFKVYNGPSPWSDSTTAHWEALLLLQVVEHHQAQAQAIEDDRYTPIADLSPYERLVGDQDVFRRAANRLNGHVAENLAIKQGIWDLCSMVQTAIDEAHHRSHHMRCPKVMFSLHGNVNRILPSTPPAPLLPPDEDGFILGGSVHDETHGHSPPPSYPGTPEDTDSGSDGYGELWVTLSTPEPDLPDHPALLGGDDAGGEHQH
ncbi:hypothetical protein C8J57DRAFT_1222610 [Mycena rebaudengoi]|nr:hypothetical protein C8J57DRAFT_1222610 [Mycena rebaudengoi]